MVSAAPIPDAGIKNATVLKADLPSFSSNALGHFVRYRIISKDKNRSSHWSPYYLLLKEKIQEVPCSVTVTGTPKAVNLVWQHPKVSLDSNEISIFKEYDIYIRTNLTFDPTNLLEPFNGFYHIASSSSTQWSGLLPSGISWFEIAVQVPVYPKIYFSDAVIFSSARVNV
jgi:hypothetical protein